MRLNYRYQIRRWHRYLGVLAGIQFLGWTIGGLYFSWSDIDEIHGDHQRQHAHAATWSPGWVSPDSVLSQLPANATFADLRVVNILDTPVYQVSYLSGTAHEKQYILANTRTGKIRKPLSQEEAVQMAKQAFVGNPQVKKVELLTKDQVNGHHEYRQSPLPAWAVTMDHASNTTVYVAAELGAVTKFRNQKWRWFDFLWMLHTMDYQSRDNFGNWLLRAFSIAGLLTVVSGFLLYFSSSKRWRRKNKH